MIHTATFFLLSATLTLAIALALRFVPAIEHPLARWLAVSSIALSVVALLSTILRTAGLIPADIVPPLVSQLLIYRLWLPTGAALTALGCWLRYRRGVGDNTAQVGRAFLAPHLTSALCISVALSFVAVEIGKVTHDADMRQFFVASGLPVVAHYLVMGAELTGAMLLFRPRWRLPSAMGLAAIMVGGILTHANNRDPFTDSLEAVHLLILLVAIALVSLPASRDSA